MRHVLKIAVSAILCIGIYPTISNAQQLTAEQIIRQLIPHPNTRSLAPTRGITVEGALTTDDIASINLYINFEYNSDVLQQDALITLDNLASALKNDKLVHFDFLVAGHTDSAGSEQYNYKLSEKRAHSVTQYLILKGAIEPHRLLEKGFGESRLLDPQHPLDGVNRRVQIVTLETPKQ